MNTKIVILFFAAFACQVRARPGLEEDILRPFHKDVIAIPLEIASSFWGGYGNQGQNGGIDQLFDYAASQQNIGELAEQLAQIGEMIFQLAHDQAQSEQETAPQQGEEVEDEVSEEGDTVDEVETDSEQVEPPMPQLLPATLDN